MGSVSGLAVAGLIRQATALGIEPLSLYEVVGWDEGPPAGEALWRARLSSLSLGLLWERLHALCGSDEFVIELATHPDVGGMGLLGYAMMSAATLGDALEQMRWAKRLLNDDAIVIEPYGDAIAVRYELAVPDMPGARWVISHACLSLVAVCRWLTGRDLSPVAVWTRHPPFVDAASIERVLGVPLQHRMTCDACLWRPSDLTHALVSANASIHRQLGHELQLQLQILEESISWAARVSFCLEAPGEMAEYPTIASVAGRLGCRPRTLQRSLQREGTSFRSLLAEARISAARRLLLVPALRIEEIAERLGFSEASTFSRAFRRWTGVSPGVFRASRATGIGES